MDANRCLDSDLTDFNNFIVHDCDTPVLNIRDTPYKNAILIRNISSGNSRLSILSELRTKLKLNEQFDNIYGFFFINEIGNSTGNSSVVLLLRSLKKFKKVLELFACNDESLLNCYIFDDWINVLDLTNAGYSLAYLKNDDNVHKSISINKLMMFDNVEDLDLFTLIKMLDCIIEERDLVSIVVTKAKVFLTFVSNEAEEEALKALLVNFKTDFNLRSCDDKLILVKRSARMSSSNRNDLKIVVKL